MPLDIPHKLWLPPKPAIIRPASQERLLHDRVSQELLATFPFPVFSPGSAPITAAAWDPSNKSTHLTLSNSNYTATGDGTTSIMGLISINGKSTGKVYAEVTVTTLAPSSNFVGIALSSFGTGTSGGSDAATCSLTAGGSLHIGASTGGTTGGNTEPTYTTGNVVQIAFDAGGGKIWFGVNNSYASGANPGTGTNPDATGLSGTFFIYGNGNGGGSANSMVFTINSTQTYAPPSGFSKWGV